ncbi:polysaccharide biosynthesis tyrosine autokinase [Weissella paramesenteroides]|uniref:CpsD/CapB family tyrosine-protein kinase n=1 Tax=Weissella paramesenteroides TaxID=1249 RepID=UPI00223ADC8C|nr:CpsD/CapB family tyrosine-protein kinase [Weissella paramesenteroides]MCS9984075.1 polysaccharide biosynthesis tyrosine autokinase [Weissella paramesenteroides]MCS9998545.1 polysaccharide biosynthesis tyrosine autokinase [Weissella paramesenteroides]MCT0259533.1 polysaccharide biosynthesis tyrosine autokinase [Weissella paramesenteroides]
MGLFRKRNANNDTETQDKGARLVTFVEPRHVISEQFRTLRTNIEFAGAALERLQVIMFTSAEISDGKTTVSTNTAVAWAQNGKSVLYVDADMRRPTAQATFKTNNMHGLSTILASAEQPKDVVQQTFVPNLEVLTAGPTPPNPAELLNSKRMTALIEWMRNNYDIIVLDVPPIMAVSDAQVLLPQIDGVVVVTMIGKTMKSSLKRTVEMIRLGETKILGVVERVKDSGKDAGYGYGYGYGEQS